MYRKAVEIRDVKCLRQWRWSFPDAFEIAREILRQNNQIVCFSKSLAVKIDKCDNFALMLKLDSGAFTECFATAPQLLSAFNYIWIDCWL